MQDAPSGANNETHSDRIAAWTIALGLLVLALATNLLGNLLILSRFPERPSPDDLLFELLPYVGPARYLTVAALVCGFGLFLFDVLRRDRARLPAVISVFALMYTLRAAIMVLTPLASAQGEGPFVFAQQQYGMFPSGHTAAATLLVMLTPADRAPRLRRLQQVLLALMCAGLILARGLLLSYFVVQTWRTGPLFAAIKRSTGP